MPAWWQQDTQHAGRGAEGSEKETDCKDVHLPEGGWRDRWHLPGQQKTEEGVALQQIPGRRLGTSGWRLGEELLIDGAAADAMVGQWEVEACWVLCLHSHPVPGMRSCPSTGRGSPLHGPV